MITRKQEILGALTDSISFQEAGEKVGVSRQRVQQIAREHGISMQDIQQKAIMTILTNDLLRKYTSVASLSKVTGINKTTIKRSLLKAGKPPTLRA